MSRFLLLDFGYVVNFDGKWDAIEIQRVCIFGVTVHGTQVVFWGMKTGQNGPEETCFVTILRGVGT